MIRSKADTPAKAEATGLDITNRLTWAFGLMVVLFLVMTGMGVWTLTNISHLVSQLVNGGARQERLMHEWLVETKANAVRAVVLARSNDAGITKLLTSEMEATTLKITELRKRVEAILSRDEAKTLFAQIGVKRERYLQLRAEAIKQRDAGDMAEAARIVDSQVIPAVNTYVASIQMLIDNEKAWVEGSGLEAIAEAAVGRVRFVVVAVMILVLAGVILMWMVVSMTRPMIKSMRIVEAISGGDLSREVKIGSTGGEARRLILALETMRITLSQQVVGIRDTAHGLSGAASEIARGNADLSRRTEAQASALEETATSLEQLTAAVKHNANSALQADEFAAQAAKVAVRGGSAVNSVVQTIGGIAEASKKIAEITSVIDSIAFQTNILSLNAAVEAARAGEQGRGFAVVATEVRALAQRSALAAKEIKQLIDESAQRVATGASEAEAAGKTMLDIVDAIQRVSEVNSAIAGASREQLSGLEQIGSAMAHLDGATQQNAALVQETSAAADSMSGQVQTLVGMVSQFKLAQSFAAREFDESAGPAHDTHHSPQSRARSRASGAAKRIADRAA